MKRKTNISVQDNLGTRVKSNMIVGEKHNGYLSGDILDANAIIDVIKTVPGGDTPTKLSQLQNDVGFITMNQVEDAGYATSEDIEDVQDNITQLEDSFDTSLGSTDEATAAAIVLLNKKITIVQNTIDKLVSRIEQLENA